LKQRFYWHLLQHQHGEFLQHKIDFKDTVQIVGSYHAFVLQALSANK